MYPYHYIDFLQLQMDHEKMYNFEDHIAESANAFVPDEKGFFEDHCPPIPMTLATSDAFGSSYASSSSRSPSVRADDLIKSESPDDDFIAVPTCPSSRPVMKENTKTTSFENACVPQRQSPRTAPSQSPIPPKLSGSKATARIIPPASESPPPLLSNRKRRCIISSSPVQLSDEDADDESDNVFDDDEYIPSPRPTTKRRRTSYTFSRRSAPLIRNPSLPPAPIKRVLGTSLSRNKQTSSVSAINKACDGPNLSFICPECGWKQANKRLPDFKRHLRTHTRPDDSDQSKGWWCKGVLLEEAHKFDLPNDAKSYVFLGRKRIGGCMQTFSRRDALKRHLDNANVTCVGKPNEAWDA